MGKRGLSYILGPRYGAALSPLFPSSLQLHGRKVTNPTSLA